MKGQLPKRPGDQALTIELRERLRGLAPALAVKMRQVIRLHAAGDRKMSVSWLLEVAEHAPDHPEVLFWQGLHHLESGDWPQAVHALGRAAAQRDDDFRIWFLLATAQGHDDDAIAAKHSLEQAARYARSASDWLKLSIQCDSQGQYELALASAQALLRLEPSSAIGLLQRSRCNKALGHGEAAAADCRTLIAAGRETARAWFSLVDLKTVVLSAVERRQLEAAALRNDVPAERRLLDFALGKALEDAGEFERALAVFQRANQSVRITAPWDAAGFARRIAEVRAAFEDKSIVQAKTQGSEIIFIVGLPRSGSTLIEQVLAAHPLVEGASELPYLGQVINAESRRRGRAFPAWVNQASQEDWTRLGQHYLRLSARWRLQKPIATDKLPDNWLFVGAIRAMLPGAHIIDCRRDPLETCWSCYKQLFGPGLANFSYDFDSLAQYWRACESFGDFWVKQDPGHVRIQHYESLVAEPESQIRALLNFCELPFDIGCLEFQSAKRAIRTPSALQVRRPMQQPSTPAAPFGALLDPLRVALDEAR